MIATISNIYIYYLAQAERSALRDIQERDDIIIKPADKECRSSHG